MTVGMTRVLARIRATRPDLDELTDDEILDAIRATYGDAWVRLQTREEEDAGDDGTGSEEHR